MRACMHMYVIKVRICHALVRQAKGSPQATSSIATRLALAVQDHHEFSVVCLAVAVWTFSSVFAVALA